MSATLMAVVIGGALGAPARYLLDRAVTQRTAGASRMRAMPWGLIVVNGLGSALAGVFLVATTGDLRILLLSGFCGAFTTFSGFAWEADRLWSTRRSDFWLTIALITGSCIALFAAAAQITRGLVG